MPADQVLTTSWSDGTPRPLAFCVPEGRMTAAEMNAWNLSHEGTSYVLSSGSNTHFMPGESWCVLLEQLLKAWHAFLHSLKQPHITTFERDRLVLALPRSTNLPPPFHQSPYENPKSGRKFNNWQAFVTTLIKCIFTRTCLPK